MFIVKAEPPGGRFGPGPEVRVVGLRQVDHLLVGTEIHVAQLRVAVEAEALDHQRLELAHQEVGQEEDPHVLFRSALELVDAREEGIAMRARQPLQPLFE